MQPENTPSEHSILVLLNVYRQTNYKNPYDDSYSYPSTSRRALRIRLFHRNRFHVELDNYGLCPSFSNHYYTHLFTHFLVTSTISPVCALTKFASLSLIIPDLVFIVTRQFKAWQDPWDFFLYELDLIPSWNHLPDLLLRETPHHLSHLSHNQHRTHPEDYLLPICNRAKGPRFLSPLLQPDHFLKTYYKNHP